MEVITSVKNEVIVKTKKIKLEPNNKLFLENPKLIKEAYLLGLNINYCLISQSKKEYLLSSYSFLNRVNIILVGDNIISSLSDTKSPQGIIAVIDFEKKSIKKPNGNFIVLENLQDAGNLGTIIRSCRGTDFKDIYLINCVNYLNQKVVRSAMGNLFSVNLYSFQSTSLFLDFVKTNNLNLCGADLNGKNLFEIKSKPKNLGIVIGNEGNGISSEMKNYISNFIKIPMKNGLESLNAGVSCSIIMYYLDNL